MPDYRAESCEIKDPLDIKQEWSELQERADCSYFQSWGWIGIWLEQVAMDLRPIVIKVWSDERLIGMSVFVKATIKRHVLISSRAMFLNEFPLEGRNMVIEYNGLLTAKDCEKVVYEQTVQILLDEFIGNDEFMFSAIAEDDGFDDLLDMQLKDAKFIINESSSSWFVELPVIPEGIDSYLAALSKNRRAQIRRSMKLYEERGPLRIEEANSVEEALMFFDGLKKLHTQRWQSKGKQGSFANPQWEAFHRALIQQRFEAGEIQCLKLSNAVEAIGYLYNFVWRKHVYVLQTGFGESDDKRLMPGYVTHVYAILYNKSKGMLVYDLMHGDSLYKRLLCNRSQKLHWLVLQRWRLKFTVEKFTVDLVRVVKKLI